MAKLRLGALAGSVSGSIGCWTFTHNRYGAVARLRSKPVTVDNSVTQGVRNIMSRLSRAWGNLDPAEQLAWKTWASVNPITDPLGDKQVLQPNDAYIQCNARILAGEAPTAVIDTPGTAVAPNSFTTCTATYTIAGNLIQLNWTPDPLPATCKVWVQAALVNRPGMVYVKNQMRFIRSTDLIPASPTGLNAKLEAVFGTLTAGLTLHWRAYVFDSATGLLSAPVSGSGLLV
jgi:hypothetical protein